MTVPGTPKQTATDSAAAGWDALAEGRWVEARALFERTLEAEETPRAAEGLAWAAWWLDDAGATFDARERAYRLYEQRGEAAGAARVATWLAADHMDFRGEMAAANGWLARAHRLLDPIEPGSEHGWLAFHEGYIVRAGGNTVEARRLAAQAAELGRQFGVPDLEMLGLALEGSSLVTLARVDEGMRCLDEAAATALAGEASTPISIGWTFCFLIAACKEAGDFERAREWCDRVVDFSGRYGSSYLLAISRTHLAAVDMWRGDWERAEAQLEEAAELYERSRPPYVGGALVSLAELRRRQGREPEAERLLERASDHPLSALGRAAIALDRGDALGATDLAERLLRQIPEENRMDRATALELQIRAESARGEPERAAQALDELRRTAELMGTRPLTASVRLAEGRVVAAAGEHERARPQLEDAVDLFQRIGAPFEAAQARLALAGSLTALGRGKEAEREARAALEVLEELGAAGEAGRARDLLQAASGEERPGEALPELTPRETEVLGLVAEGLTNAQIAERLVVSEHTVHRHVTNMLRKLDLPSRAAAAAEAGRLGLLGDPPE